MGKWLLKLKEKNKKTGNNELTKPTEDPFVSFVGSPLPVFEKTIPVFAPKNRKPYPPEEPVKQIKTIENIAYLNNWTPEQLWRKSKRPDEWGLIMVLKSHQHILAVSEKYITLRWIDPTGEERQSCFYNMRVEQPWLKRSSV